MIPNSELGITGALMDLIGTPPPNLGNVLRCAPDSFDDLRCGQVAVAIRALRENTEGPVDPGRLLRVLEFDDALEFLEQISASVLPLQIAEIAAERNWADYRGRRARAALRNALLAIESNPGQLDTVLDSTIKCLSVL